MLALDSIRLRCRQPRDAPFSTIPRYHDPASLYFNAKRYLRATGQLSDFRKDDALDLPLELRRDDHDARERARHEPPERQRCECSRLPDAVTSDYRHTRRVGRRAQNLVLIWRRVASTSCRIESEHVASKSGWISAERREVVELRRHELDFGNSLFGSKQTVILRRHVERPLSRPVAFQAPRSAVQDRAYGCGLSRPDGPLATPRSHARPLLLRCRRANRATSCPV